MKQYQKLIAMSRMHLANGNERAYKAQISGLLRSARSAKARKYLLDEMASDGFKPNYLNIAIGGNTHDSIR